MIKKILDAVGLPYRKTRFTQPPSGAYIVYMDGIETSGPDGINAIRTHEITIELYSPLPNDEIEENIENVLDEHGVGWTKQDRYWLQSEQLYQVVYEFNYKEKRRI